MLNISKVQSFFRRRFLVVLFLLHQEFGRGDDLGHMLIGLLLTCSSILLLLCNHSKLHLLALILDLFGLLNHHVLPLHVQVRLIQLDNTLELLVVIHLVQVHAIGQHLFNIAKLYWETGRQILAVNLNARRIGIVEAPHVDLFNVEHKVGTCLPMQRFVFLHWVNRHPQKIWSTDDIPLELHEIWVLSLEMSVETLQSNSDLFVLVTDVEGADLIVR